MSSPADPVVAVTSRPGSRPENEPGNEPGNRPGNRPGGRPPGDPRSLVHGLWRADVVRAVLDLELPDRIGEATVPVEELAAAVGADADRLDRLITLSASIGILEQPEAHTVANSAASSLLRSDHPRSMRPEAMHALATWARIAWDNVAFAVVHGGSGFEPAVGTGVFPYLAGHPDQAADFDAFQAVVTARNAAALVAGWSPPPGSVVVDVGGGTGQLLSTLLLRRPDLTGVVLDRAAAVRGVEHRVAAEPRLAGRLRGVAGDFFTSVPAGGDVYLLSHVLHDWDDDDAVRLLRTVAARMGEGTSLVILENVDDDPDALLVAYLDLLMLTAWGSRERSPGAYADLLSRAGLELVGCELLEPRSRLAVLTARRAGTGTSVT